MAVDCTLYKICNIPICTKYSGIGTDDYYSDKQALNGDLMKPLFN